MTTKTTYKVIEYKGANYLQYLKLYRLFFFFKHYNWAWIPYPNEQGKPQVVCSNIPEYASIRRFVFKYPDIKKYYETEYLERKNKFKNIKH
jgi:hypothetical protein